MYVRFGGEYWETYHRNMTRRRVLSLHNYTAELKMEDINTDPNAKPIKFDVTVDKWKDTTPGDDLNLTDKKN